MRLKDADADLKPMAASVAQSSAAVLYPLSPRYASVTAAFSRQDEAYESRATSQEGTNHSDSYF